jgi:flavin reductase (DIM6/NTAB) family NADH-FMN oxidoreductase RutF
MDIKTFKAALSRWATGVTVITTRTPEGELAGFTASSFSSLSLEPPLVLFCLGDAAVSLPAFQAADGFAVHVLADNQKELSIRFAQQGGDKFDGLDYREGNRSVPLLQGCLAVLECRKVQVYSGGDHRVFLGEVETVHLNEGGPLLYYRGEYRTL